MFGIFSHKLIPRHRGNAWNMTGSPGKKGFKEYDIAADRGQDGEIHITASLTALPCPIQNEVPVEKSMPNIFLI